MARRYTPFTGQMTLLSARLPDAGLSASLPIRGHDRAGDIERGTRWRVRYAAYRSIQRQRMEGQNRFPSADALPDVVFTCEQPCRCAEFWCVAEMFAFDRHGPFHAYPEHDCR